MASLTEREQFLPQRNIACKARPFSDANHGCAELNKRYRVLEMVGKGTFGEVSKAQLRGSSSHEMVAVKRIVVARDVYKQSGFPVTAVREISILKALHHNNVVELKEVAVDPTYVDSAAQHGGFHMVLSYMQYDLAGLLKRGVVFKLGDAMCITQQILQGLTYVHNKGIMHRDMKSANILVDSDGNVRITDFGLARYVCHSDRSRYTGTHICTRWYRPPEILLGDIKYTAVVDTWGVGCIFAELLVGDAILKGGSHIEDVHEGDIDQYVKICELCGTPTESSWPSASTYRAYGKFFFVPKKSCHKSLEERIWKRTRARHQKFFPDHWAALLGEDSAGATANEQGTTIVHDTVMDFLDGCLTMNPAHRLTSKDALLHNVFFLARVTPTLKAELPLPSQSCHEYTQQATASAAPQTYRNCT